MTRRASSIARETSFMPLEFFLLRQKHLYSHKKIFYGESNTIYNVLTNKDYTIQTTTEAKTLPVIGKKLPDIKRRR